MRRTCATVLAAAGLTTVAACVGSSSGTSSSAMPVTHAPTSSVTSGGAESYAGQVSALCAALQLQEQASVESFPPHFPLSDFLADAARFRPLLRAFDAKLAALPVRPADQAAAAAFAAYVKESTVARQLASPRLTAARPHMTPSTTDRSSRTPTTRCSMPSTTSASPTPATTGEPPGQLMHRNRSR